jgi:hypothetical protein
LQVYVVAVGAVVETPAAFVVPWPKMTRDSVSRPPVQMFTNTTFNHQAMANILMNLFIELGSLQGYTEGS